MTKSELLQIAEALKDGLAELSEIAEHLAETINKTEEVNPDYLEGIAIAKRSVIAMETLLKRAQSSIVEPGRH